MRLKMFLAALIVSAAIPTYGQVAPEATNNRWPLTVGFGYSNYYTDWAGHLSGPMFWADWQFIQLPSYLSGLGVEVEGRDLNYGRKAGLTNLRMDAAGGGAVYTVRNHHGLMQRVNPYAKFLIEDGSIDFTIEGYPNYTHDTRQVYVPGGGLNVHILPNVVVRGDYEYQFWPDLVNHHALNPRGLTFSVAYDLRGHSYR